MTRKAPTFGTALYYLSALMLGGYFTFAAVQGNSGLFRRIEVQAEAESLIAERDLLRRDVAEMTNLTHRLSDAYLDLDLLDERARDVLGMARADEVVVN